MPNKQSLKTDREQRRVIRLLSLFEPYRFLRVQLTDELREPITLDPAGISRQRPYTVKIWRRLLCEGSPDWLEYALLSHARNLVYQFERQISPESKTYSVTNSYRELLEFSNSIQPPLRTTDVISPKKLRDAWGALQEEYFPDRADLLTYRVRWSNRGQRTCLASCNVEKRTINVAKLFEQPAYNQYLAPLLYHEMCHAVLGKPLEQNGRRILHGTDFKTLERRHPGIAMLDGWIKNGGWHQAAKRWRRQQRALR